MTEVDLITQIFMYAQSIPSHFMSADVFAISLVLISAYIIVLIINKLTGLIIFFLKKVILLTIITVAFHQFLTDLVERVLSEGISNDVVIFGAGGFIAGFVAIAFSLYAAFASMHKIKNDKVVEDKDVKEQAFSTEVKNQNPVEEVMKMLSMEKLKNDKSIGAVLTYLIIAEFGVFSSKTISAPNAEVGMWFFIVFMVAALIFIHQSYKNYIRGISHLIISLIVGGSLSILLGHFWGDIPMETLLSLEFFKTDSLVALVTGLSVSLFMSSKG